ncbi:hypothetical protein Acr_18g0009980 [Actinidia rufa]|uniref:Uncharacterized protein n=1 Tax=Actinidia rufa TaxID=165716 RepID=A0A7J0G7Z5_9ERIC|nr:hypothetical protein Acr_18g0009980 [Actinidia rufa]
MRAECWRSSCRDETPIPNRVRNGVRTRPHAPPEHRRVRSISATRLGRFHALPRARGEYPRACTHQRGACTRCHMPGEAPTCPHAHSRTERSIPRADTRQEGDSHTHHTPTRAVEIAHSKEAATRAPYSKGCSFDASGGILRVFKENKEILWEKKTGGLYLLEGSVQTGGVTVRHGSSSISKKSGQGKQPLHRGTQSKRKGTWRIQSCTRAQGDALGYVQKSGQIRVVQPMQDVHKEAQRKETKSILRRCTAKGAVTPKRVSFALDLISGGDLSSCAHKGGEIEPRKLAK